AQNHPEAPAMLVGCGVLRFDAQEEHYSGAVLIDSKSEVASWYGKRHLVMFGEYVPFAGWMPWLYKVLPISGGVTPGPEPVAMEVDDFLLAPNICFETVVEHVTIHQVRELAARGDAPDMVINITNDAWFDGSSLLDHHRRCSQMVAIGCRRPVLMASNVGPTVWVDGAGRIVQSLPKQTHGSILARPVSDGRWGLYQAIGDWPARGLAFACLVLAVIGIRESRQRRRHQGSALTEPESSAAADS
ncbi:MAG: nitrilase-related carbon-nitrogen hydrolase, partial [Pirellulaceae bacterium]